MLAVAGRLNAKAGGPSVIVPVEQELVNLLYKPSQWAVTKDAAEHDRRSIYLLHKRNLRLPLMEVFDAPGSADIVRPARDQHACAASARTAEREIGQRLAQSLASRLDREARTTRCAGRPGVPARRWAASPTPKEKRIALQFLQDTAAARVRTGSFQSERFPVRGLMHGRALSDSPATAASF